PAEHYQYSLYHISHRCVFHYIALCPGAHREQSVERFIVHRKHQMGNFGNSARTFLISSMPLAPGKLRSTIARSGFSLRITPIPSAASPASPLTAKAPSDWINSWSPFRNSG